MGGSSRGGGKRRWSRGAEARDERWRMQAEMVHHYQPDAAACVRAILALLALPNKADGCSPLSKVESSHPGPANEKSPAGQRVAHHRRRVEAARRATAPP